MKKTSFKRLTACIISLNMMLTTAMPTFAAENMYNGIEYQTDEAKINAAVEQIYNTNINNVSDYNLVLAKVKEVNLANGFKDEEVPYIYTMENNHSKHNDVAIAYYGFDKDTHEPIRVGAVYDSNNNFDGFKALTKYNGIADNKIYVNLVKDYEKLEYKSAELKTSSTKVGTKIVVKPDTVVSGNSGEFTFKISVKDKNFGETEPSINEGVNTTEDFKYAEVTDKNTGEKYNADESLIVELKNEENYSDKYDIGEIKTVKVATYYYPSAYNVKENQKYMYISYQLYYEDKLVSDKLGWVKLSNLDRFTSSRETCDGNFIAGIYDTPTTPTNENISGLIYGYLADSVKSVDVYTTDEDRLFSMRDGKGTITFPITYDGYIDGFVYDSEKTSKLMTYNPSEVIHLQKGDGGYVGNGNKSLYDLGKEKFYVTSNEEGLDNPKSFIRAAYEYDLGNQYGSTGQIAYTSGPVLKLNKIDDSMYGTSSEVKDAIKSLLTGEKKKFNGSAYGFRNETFMIGTELMAVAPNLEYINVGDTYTGSDGTKELFPVKYTNKISETYKLYGFEVSEDVDDVKGMYVKYNHIFDDVAKKNNDNTSYYLDYDYSSRQIYTLLTDKLVNDLDITNKTQNKFNIKTNTFALGQYILLNKTSGQRSELFGNVNTYEEDVNNILDKYRTESSHYYNTHTYTKMIMADPKPYTLIGSYVDNNNFRSTKTIWNKYNGNSYNNMDEYLDASSNMVNADLTGIWVIQPYERRIDNSFGVQQLKTSAITMLEDGTVVNSSIPLESITSDDIKTWYRINGTSYQTNTTDENKIDLKVILSEDGVQCKILGTFDKTIVKDGKTYEFNSRMTSDATSAKDKELGAFNGKIEEGKNYLVQTPYVIVYSLVEEEQVEPEKPAPTPEPEKPAPTPEPEKPIIVPDEPKEIIEEPTEPETKQSIKIEEPTEPKTEPETKAKIEPVTKAAKKALVASKASKLTYTVHYYDMSRNSLIADTFEIINDDINNKPKVKIVAPEIPGYEVIGSNTAEISWNELPDIEYIFTYRSVEKIEKSPVTGFDDSLLNDEELSQVINKIDWESKTVTRIGVILIFSLIAVMVGLYKGLMHIAKCNRYTIYENNGSELKKLEHGLLRETDDDDVKEVVIDNDVLSRVDGDSVYIILPDKYIKKHKYIIINVDGNSYEEGAKSNIIKVNINNPRPEVFE